LPVESLLHQKLVKTTVLTPEGDIASAISDANAAHRRGQKSVLVIVFPPGKREKPTIPWSQRADMLFGLNFSDSVGKPSGRGDGIQVYLAWSVFQHPSLTTNLPDEYIIQMCGRVTRWDNRCFKHVTEDIRNHLLAKEERDDEGEGAKTGVRLPDV
jgi:hypothetical protein